MSTTPRGFDDKLDTYLSQIRQANSEAAKLFSFLHFALGVFESIKADTIGKMFPELERSLSGAANAVAIRGRVDAFLGNVLIEFKTSLSERARMEAESQLRRYISILWSQQGRRVPYVAVASDGINFVAYRPRAEEINELAPDDVFLDEIDRITLDQIDNGTAFLWLDRYLLSQALRPANSDAISSEFGMGKSVFNDASTYLQQAWKELDESVLYDQWAQYLRIVYGSRVDSEDLFFRHTYLATVAKLVVYSVYSGGALPVSEKQITDILEGEVFRRWGVLNFLEEDFFSWVARTPKGKEFTRNLLESLSKFDLTGVDEDILKSLYQELVDPKDRHDLGEYYTPDWLAQLMVREVVGEDPTKTVLDPACGSGTFLAASIREKKKLLSQKRPSERLKRILDSVKGVDIHPLAVILSRANFLAALGTELLSSRKGEISVPVYLADSIREPDLTEDIYHRTKTYKIKAEGETLRIPREVASDPLLTDSVVEIIRKLVNALSKNEDVNTNYVRSLISVNDLQSKINPDQMEVIKDTAEAMYKLKKRKKDTIWAFILKNIYKPLFLKDQKFDVVIGNPPWLSYRYVESTDYQEFLKKLIMKDYNLLDSGRAELITQMELASLFLIRAADLYLNEKGTISFVMPRGIFSADQYDNVRNGRFKPPLRLKELYDLKDVRPLFKVPSCVVTAEKGTLKYPMRERIFEGTLPAKNLKLEDAMKSIKETRTKINLFQMGKRSFLETEKFSDLAGVIKPGQRSSYYSSFTQGATIVPRSAWFVDLVSHPLLGVNPTKPRVETSKRAADTAKDEYKDVKIKGEVEAQFLFKVVTGSELAPFCITTLPLAVLPIESNGNGFHVIPARQAKERGFAGLSEWLIEGEAVWNKKRGEKAGKISLYDWLNYSNKLTNQSPRTKYRVVYNASGSSLASCIINNRSSKVKVGGSTVEVSGVIADAKVYRYDTNDVNEALYLTAVLNAPIINTLVKPLQSRGDFGERDFHKKVLELPIPRFNSGNQKHKDLVNLAKKAYKKAERSVLKFEKEYSGIGRIRSMVRVVIDDELSRIDSIVRELLDIKKYEFESE